MPIVPNTGLHGTPIQPIANNAGIAPAQLAVGGTANYGVGGSEQGQEVAITDVMKIAIDENISLSKILARSYAHLAYIWLDVAVTNGDKPHMKAVDVKDINGVKASLTTDGVSVAWGEYGYADFSTTMSADVTGAANSDVTLDVLDTSGFAKDDTIFTLGSEDPASPSDELTLSVKTINSPTQITCKVDSINGFKVVPGASTAFTVKEKVTVQRGYWKRNDQEEITRPDSMYGAKTWHSYIQHFSRRLTFTKQEINVVYTYLGGPKKFCNEKLSYNMAILMQELDKALIKGLNRAPVNGDKMELYGLETLVYDLEALNPGKHVYDLSQGTSDPLMRLFDAIEYVQKSSAVPTGNVTMMINPAFVSEISRVKQDRIRVTDIVTKLGFELPALVTPFGKIEMVSNNAMSIFYKYPAAYIFSKDLMSMWYRKNETVDENGNIKAADKVVKVRAPQLNTYEGVAYDVFFEIGTIFGGLGAENPPYVFVKNFKGT